MIKTYAEASVKVTYKDGSVEETPLNYNQLFLSKDKIVDNKGGINRRRYTDRCKRGSNY